MKKAIIILSSVWIIVSCGNNKSSESTTNTDQNATTAAAAPKNPEVEKGLALVGKNDCFSCHKISETAVGPAYQLVAQKYAGASSDVVDTLAEKVIKGGSGHWGTVPMTPHPNLSKDDAKAMVTYVLSLKQ